MRPSFSAGKLLFEPCNVPHRHTQTRATHTYTHANMKVHPTRMQVSTCAHAPGDTKPAQHSCAFVWCERGHPGGRGRFPASLILNLWFLSVSVSVSAPVPLCPSQSHSPSRSVSPPIYFCLTVYYFRNASWLSVIMTSKQQSIPQLGSDLQYNYISFFFFDKKWYLELHQRCSRKYCSETSMNQVEIAQKVTMEKDEICSR